MGSKPEMYNFFNEDYVTLKEYRELETELEKIKTHTFVDLEQERFEKLQAQLEAKDKLLLIAFQDAKKGVVQMTRKYDEWITYLQAALNGEEK